MFTELVRVGCSFPACRGGSIIYQTCYPYIIDVLTYTPREFELGDTPAGI